MNNNSLFVPSLDFIAGIISSYGSFMWVKQNGNEIPVFQIKVQLPRRNLVDLIVQKLELTSKIHEYTNNNRSYALLLVRNRSDIETKLIPAIDGRLCGSQRNAFDIWMRRYFEKKVDFLYKKHR